MTTYDMHYFIETTSSLVGVLNTCAFTEKFEALSSDVSFFSSRRNASINNLFSKPGWFIFNKQSGTLLCKLKGSARHGHRLWVGLGGYNPPNIKSKQYEPVNNHKITVNKIS